MGKKRFFDFLRSQHLAVTFDDVRFRTGYSKVAPDAVNVESRFSRNVPLKIPIVSAAMDRVTEHLMAIELAKLGGLGIIHRNLSLEEQVKQVAKVKHYISGLVAKPITISPEQTVDSVLQMRQSKDYGFHTFPVIDAGGRLVGIVSEDDFAFCRAKSSPIKNIMSKDLLTAPLETTFEQAYEIMMSNRKKCLPLVAKKGELRSMYVLSDVERELDKNGPAINYNLDNKGRLRVGAAIGLKIDGALDGLDELLREEVDVLVIDTAHADTNVAIETLAEIKSKYKNIDVVVGNVSEYESAKRLADAAADGIKVGQGPGSICTTTPVAGYGCPQISAVYNCLLAVEERDIPICADGGMRYSGDIAKAIGLGADSVMLGEMLAGTKETPGEIITRDGKQYKEYRGMGSIAAMQAGAGARNRYRQSKNSPLVPEGVEALAVYKGELAPLMAQYLGGLRKGMAGAGAASIKEMQEKADFFMVTSAGKTESHPHDVFITREPANYRR
jgi:IMP dehydrogenase